MFKIVQQNRFVGLNNPQKISELMTVPKAWHVGLIGKEGNLYWPRRMKLKKIENLRKTPNACPQQDWEIQKCISKRTGFQTFEAAEIVLSIMQSRLHILVNKKIIHLIQIFIFY